LNSNNGKVPVTFLGPELYEARYYDPKIGRFYGVDPVGYRDVHSYNRFAYANNNPYKFVDPDGKNPLLLCLIPLGAPACAGVGQFIVDTITVVIGVAGIVDTIQKTTPQKEDKAKGKKVKDRGNPDLPENPDNLVDDGYEETSHSDAKKKGHRTFENPETGDKVRHDKGKKGSPSHKGKDHYHRYNPDRTNKRDQFLDKEGNPVSRGSNKSHLYPPEKE